MTEWKLPGFTIPGRFIDPKTSLRGDRWASYMAGDLHSRIESIAGPGDKMRWRHEWEIARYFRDSDYFQWGWVACGDHSWKQDLANQMNTQDSMRIVFRDAKVAILARLSV